jgi:hypothetical protein
MWHTISEPRCEIVVLTIGAKVGLIMEARISTEAYLSIEVGPTVTMGMVLSGSTKV